MKKGKIIIPILLGMFMLTSCDFLVINPDASDNNDQSESESVQESPQTEEPAEGDKLKSNKPIDFNINNYVVGDNFIEDSMLYLRNTYESGHIYDEPLNVTKVNRITNTDEKIDIEGDFTIAGNYKATISYQYVDPNNVAVSKTHTFVFKVKSGTDVNLMTLKAFDFAEPFAMIDGETLAESNPNFVFEATWNKEGEEEPIYEKMSYSKRAEDITLNLYKKGTSDNIYDQPLSAETTYVFEAFLNKYSTFAAKNEFTVSKEKGYYTLENPDLLYSDFTDASLPTGDSNMIVILLDFEPGNTDYVAAEWNNSNISKVNNYFFGDENFNAGGWVSLKEYYSNVSLDQINVSGQVFGPVKPDYTMAEVTSGSIRKSVLNAAISEVKSTYSTVDWTAFDKNSDGYFDNLHFISNCVISQSNVPWGGPLWPHKHSLYNSKGTPASPNGNVYELSALDPNYFKDATTIIHEQGHMFGLPDYYDYSYSGADYVGFTDMQSHNIFDWNSWSKFSVGWANPYVVDGKASVTKFTFQSAQKTNQCVIIPANIDTYNNSAFDEFFLLELITNDGNASKHWGNLNPGLNEAGVRLYHVDARLWNTSNGTLIDNPTDAINGYKNGYYVDLRTTNTTTFGEYASIAREADHDFKTLALIQQGGVDTFGQQNETARHELDFSDLFLTGDTFDFETYKHFLSKSGQTVTTMDNGEAFPYSIYFNYVGKDGCTITVSKI